MAERRFDPYPRLPAMLQRLRGIFEQVDHHLHQGIFVDVGEWQGWIITLYDSNVFCKSGGRDIRRSVDQRIDVAAAALQRPVGGEVLHTVDQSGDPRPEEHTSDIQSLRR